MNEQITDATAANLPGPGLSRARERWRRVAPTLVAAVLFGAAVVALHYLLRDVNYPQMLAQLRALAPQSLLLAIVFTAAGYAALVGYDWSALRTLAIRLPLRTVALASFCGYAIGNTVGLGVLTGGSVRYRIYSAVGLSAADIAGIAVFCAIAFGTGITVVGLAALAIHPDALGQLVLVSASTLRAVSVLALAVIATLLIVALGMRKSLHIGRWTLTLPSASIVLGQLLFSLADLSFSAATLYVLISDPRLPFLTFVAIYSIAAATAVLSHVPGGIGVFEGIILLALGNQVTPTALAAALLAYRAVYYLLPLALATVLLVLNEIARGARTSALAARLGGLAELGARLVPTALAAMTLVSAAVLLIASATPLSPATLEELKDWLPLAALEVSQLGASLAGVFLIVLARGLLHRLNAAYWLTLAVLLGAALLALVRGFDLDQALVLLFSALLLAPCRRAFYRPTKLIDLPLTPGWLLALTVMVAATAWVVVVAHRSVPYSHDLWWQFAFDDEAPRALRAALGAGLGAILALLYSLRPPPARPVLPDAAALERATAVIRDQDIADANFALLGDKSLLFSESGRGFLMFGVQGRSWVALNGPIGDTVDARELAWRFRDLAERSGGRAAFYQVSTESIPLYLDLGLTLNKLGEEARVLLTGFTLDGPAHKALRYTTRRAGREGLHFELREPPADDTLIDELSAISDAWLATRQTREKGFSLGRFAPHYVRRFPLALVYEGGRLSAFATVFTTATRAEATIDLMRYRPDASQLTMEYLFIELMLALKARGVGEFSLGMAPLSGLDDAPGGPTWNRLGALLYHHGTHFYNFQGLRQFKDKFRPEWRPRYLATSRGLDPALVALDIAALISGGLRGLVGK